MNAPFEIIACGPDEALFSAVLPKIYCSDLSTQPHNEIDKDYLVSCMVITREGETLGRLSIYQNDKLTYKGKRVVQLGNFECVNDTIVAKALLGHALIEAKNRGAELVIGPMNGSTWSQYRFISSTGDNPVFFTEQSHPLYYHALWESVGFSAFQEYFSNIASIEAPNFDPGIFFANNELTVRSIDINSLEADLVSLHPLCMDAFAPNPLFTPISRDRFVSKFMVLKPLLGKSFSKIALDSTGSPVAFILCLPDIYDVNGKTLVLKTAAKHSDCNIHRVASALYHSITSEAFSDGYRSIIHAFIHAGNKSLERSHELAGREIRRYSLYIHAC